VIIKKQIKQLLLGKSMPVLKGNLRGLRLIMDKNLNASIIWRNYEPDKQLALSIFSEKEKVFFDLGANVGLHSYFIAREFPQNKVFSFEPLPSNAEYIRRIVKLNRFGNIQVHEMACGSFDGQVNFAEGETNLEGKVTPDNTGLSVKIRTLDSIISELNVEPALLKIDVEGAERDVLDGFRQNINLLNPVMVIELHSPKQDKLVAEFLLNHNFEVFRLDALPAALSTKKILARIKNLNATWPDPDGVWANIVAIPRGKLKIYEKYFAA
jgi:FkbM family methyltransferase